MARHLPVAILLGLAACNAILGINPPVSSDAGSEAPCGDAGLADAGLAYADISAGQGAESGHTPVALIDALNGKLIVVTDDGANNDQLGLFRCNLNGSCCNYSDISANQGPRTGYTPSAVIDTTNQKLLVAAVNSATSFVGLFRCNLDGTDCAFTDISGQVQGQYPSMTIDTTSNKLLVVTLEQGLTLARCELDGSQCAHSDLGGGHFSGSGPSRPSATVDTMNDQLLVAVGGTLTTSALDGSNPQTTDLAATLGFDAGADGGNSSAVVDMGTSSLLIAESSTTDKPALFLAALDGGDSTFVNMAVGQQFGSGNVPSAVIDVPSQTLFVATIKQLEPSTLFEPALFQCDTDGTNCSYTDITAGRAPDSGASFSDAVGVSAVMDATNNRLLVVATDGANENRLGLFAYAL